MKETRIYFVQMRSPVGEIKIGLTRDLRARLNALQTGSPYPLRVLAALPGTEAEEHELHTRFADLRLSGEWFRPEPRLLEFVAQLPPAPPLRSYQRGPVLKGSLRLKDAAGILRVDRHTVRKWMDQGLLTEYRICNGLHIRLDEVEVLDLARKLGRLTA